MATFKVTTNQGVYNVTVDGDTPPSNEQLMEYINNQQTLSPEQDVMPEVKTEQQITNPGESYLDSRKRKLSEFINRVKNIPQNIMGSELVQNTGPEVQEMGAQFMAAPILDTLQMAYNAPVGLVNKMINPLEDKQAIPLMPQLMKPKTATQAAARLAGDFFANKVYGGMVNKKAAGKTMGFLSDLPEDMMVNVVEKPYLMEKSAPKKIGEQIGVYKKELQTEPIGQILIDNKSLLTKIKEERFKNDFGGQGPLTESDLKELLDVYKKASATKTLEQAQGLKMDLQQNYIKWGAKGDSYNQMLQSIADSINQQIAKVYPDLANANSDYSFLSQFNKELEYLNSSRGKYPRNYKSMIAAGTLGGALGIARHDPVGGVALAALLEGMSTPLVQAQVIKYARPLNQFMQKVAPIQGVIQLAYNAANKSGAGR